MKQHFFLPSVINALLLLNTSIEAQSIKDTSVARPKSIRNLVLTNAHYNSIPERLQWNENSGYCGEVSLIAAGLYYGQYMSQYDARAAATVGGDQSDQLLLGVNAVFAATQMHLNSIAWDTKTKQNTANFLAWVRKNVVKGYPVAIGIYTNEYRFYGKKNPNAGDTDYDHIVPVIGIESSYPLNDGLYHADDVIYFSDNGLWGNSYNHPFIFNYTFEAFQASRQQANAKQHAIYSLSNDGANYGLAISGVMDLKKETYPVRITTNVNAEKPEIKNNSSKRPAPCAITLTITVSNLTPNVSYTLYRYNTLASVPDSKFNEQHKKAYQSWKINIPSGSSFEMRQKIQSNEIAIYRAVKS